VVRTVVITATATTAPAIITGRIVRTAALADVTRSVIGTATLTDVTWSVIGTAGLTDITRRIIAATALADVIGWIIGTTPGKGCGTGQQLRGGETGEQRNLERLAHHFSPSECRQRGTAPQQRPRPGIIPLGQTF
jgi:hypothetical protein